MHQPTARCWRGPDLCLAGYNDHRFSLVAACAVIFCCRQRCWMDAASTQLIATLSCMRSTCRHTEHAHVVTHSCTTHAHLVLVIQCCDVILEGVSHPSPLYPYVRHALQRVPGIWPQCCVKQLVKVVPVAEDDVSPHVKHEAFGGDSSAG
jgi:hypothetical protein